MAFGSASRAVAAMAIICVLAMAPVSVSGLSCPQVVPFIAPCVMYVRGGPLTPQCCNGVRGLNNVAQSTADRQSVCACLKNAAGAIGGINPSIVAGLPGRCGVSLPFAINRNVDCSRVR